MPDTINLTNLQIDNFEVVWKELLKKKISIIKEISDYKKVNFLDLLKEFVPEAFDNKECWEDDYIINKDLVNTVSKSLHEKDSESCHNHNHCCDSKEKPDPEVPKSLESNTILTKPKSKAVSLKIKKKPKNDESEQEKTEKKKKIVMKRKIKAINIKKHSKKHKSLVIQKKVL